MDSNSYCYDVAGTAFGAPCDRTCLKTTLDQYLNALLTHKPAAAPLSVGFRQTENAVVRKLGTGLWESATGLGKVQRRYVDPETGNAGYFGLLEEAAGSAIAALGLKAEDRKIREAEWVLSRKGDPGLGPTGGAQANAAYYDPEYLMAHQPPSDHLVPKAKRLSRTELVAVTNSYFDGLCAHDGKQILAHPGCVREENGVLTTQRALQGGDCPIAHRKVPWPTFLPSLRVAIRSLTKRLRRFSASSCSSAVPLWPCAGIS